MKRSRTAAVLVIVLTAVLGLVMTSGTANAVQLPQSTVVSAKPASFTPNILNGEVDSITQVGNWMVVGGTFTQVQAAGGTTTLTRNYIFAFDRHTGALSTTFVPTVDGSVLALAAAPDNNSVYIAGKFNTVDGKTMRKVVQLDISTGALVTTFKPPSFSAQIDDMVLNGGNLYVSGTFTKVAGQPRGGLAEISASTGALSSNLNIPFTGNLNGGTTEVRKIDVSPDGSKLVAIGNFSTVGGQDRMQAAVINLSTSPAMVANWETDRFKPFCYSVFKDYLRDVQFSPDGSYFVIGGTGGYGSGPPTLCDSVSRWPSTATGAALNPTWVDYTGGDSTYTVTPTAAAIYVGGHMRWENNPTRADAAGQGAVPRQGIAALDPTNGLPLDWNPTRTRGQGVFDMFATDDGLFVGSDTVRLGGQYHARIGFFPLAGGHAVPQPTTPGLPVNVYRLGPVSQQSNSNVLYRIDAAGPTIPAIDGGPDWQADDYDPSPYRNSGSDISTYTGLTNGLDSSVPSSTPAALFNTERWDPDDSNEMNWSFPVPAGEKVQVRLYFANNYSGTSQPGQRVFSVDLDSQPWLTDYDIVGDVGDSRGVMKKTDVVSDGSVNIQFLHHVENPLINGIEIVDDSGTGSAPDDTGVSVGRLDQSGAQPATAMSDPGTDWSTARGAFDINGYMYTALGNGTLVKRSFDGTTFGPASVVNLYGLTSFASEMQQMTGLFYLDGRIYYTLSGNSHLYSRYFSSDDDIVGTQEFTVANNLSDLNWSSVEDMFYSDGSLYWVDSADQGLHRTSFTDGVPVDGTDTVVSGPNTDGVTWHAHALAALAAPPPNQAPVAKMSVQCGGMRCNVDGMGSSDPDGTIASYEWDFGDGTTATTPTASHVYTAAGIYTVAVTVTDNDGATNTTSQLVSVAPATSPISLVGGASATTTGSSKTFSVTVPSSVAAGDAMLLFMSQNTETGMLSAPAGWSLVRSANTGRVLTSVWSKVATASDAGSRVSVSASTSNKGSLQLAAYSGTDVAQPVADSAIATETTTRTTHTTPALTASSATGWLVSYWADKSSVTSGGWTAPSDGETVSSFVGSSGGHISSLVTDSNGPVGPGSIGGKTATAADAEVNAVMASILLNPTSGQ